MLKNLGFSGLLAVVLVTTSARGVSAGRVPAEVRVAATLADLGNGASLLVASDLMGPYPGADAKATSVIRSNMQGSFWSLTTYYNSRNTLKASTRRVWFSLTEPQSPAPGQPSPPPPPVSAGLLQASLMTNCDTVSFDLLSMTQNAVGECPGLFRFQAPSLKWYKLAFQPQNYPETDRMRVVCDLAGPSGCARWTVTPLGNRFNGTDPNPKSLVRLVEITEDGAIVNSNLGNYYVSFSFTLSR